MEDKKIQMFTFERIMLPMLLPKTGSIETVKISNSIRNKLKITEEEIKAYQIVIGDGGKNISFNQKFDKGIEVDFNIGEIGLILSIFKMADDEESFPSNEIFLNFYNKFILKYGKTIS